MKSYLARPALALAVSLALASCGGGGKETFPVKVTVSNVQYPGLVLSTNGMDLPVPVPAKAGDQVVLTFPNGLNYGDYYNVVPLGGTAAGGGTHQPAHQNCVTAGYPREYGTAGQTASLESARTAAIEVFYNCSINAYPLSGTVTGLTSGSLTLVNGSSGGQITVTGSTTTTPIPFTLPPVPYGASYGVDVLPQPAGFHCDVANGTGKMLDDQEKAGGVTNVTVTCTPTAS
jgi:hypothetical protein